MTIGQRALDAVQGFGVLEQVLVEHGSALSSGEALAGCQGLVVVPVAGSQTAYRVAVNPRNIALEMDDQRYCQRDGPSPYLCSEFLARRHFGVTPLFTAVQKAYIEAQKPAM